MSVDFNVVIATQLMQMLSPDKGSAVKKSLAKFQQNKVGIGWGIAYVGLTEMLRLLVFVARSLSLYGSFIPYSYVYKHK